MQPNFLDTIPMYERIYEELANSIVCCSGFSSCSNRMISANSWTIFRFRFRMRDTQIFHEAFVTSRSWEIISRPPIVRKLVLHRERFSASLKISGNRSSHRYGGRLCWIVTSVELQLQLSTWILHHSCDIVDVVNLISSVYYFTIVFMYERNWNLKNLCHFIIKRLLNKEK